MKKSIYATIIERKNGDILIHSGLSGAVLYVKKENRAEFEIFLQGKIPTAGKPVVKSAYHTVLESLKKAKILINGGINEQHLLETWYRQIQYLKDGTIGLTISPTMKCNLACPYCYNPSERSTMSDEDCRYIGTWLKDVFLPENARVGKQLKLAIVWIGGEPLFNFDMFNKLATTVFEAAKEQHCEVSSSLITNGTLLTEKLARRLSKAPFLVKFVQVTLDGPKYIHDRKRVYKDGRSSYDTICNNARLAKKYLPISFRINTTLEISFSDMETLMDDIFSRSVVEKGEHNPSFHLGRITDIGAADSCQMKVPNGTVMPMQKFANFELECARLARSKGFPFKMAPFDSPRRIGCGKMRHNSFTIDSNCQLGKCWNAMGYNERNFDIGNLVINKDSIEYRKWMDYSPFRNEMCKKCHVLPLCGGGCAFHAMSSKDPHASCIPAKFGLKERLLFKHFEE